MRPELLTHPNIPTALHGLNPRTILGDDWWNQQRQQAYAVQDYHCWACGVHKSQAKYHRWLEAHEAYQIDYTTGRVELQEIVALCHACHNFIHSGRLWMQLQAKHVSEAKVKEILAHGFAILTAYNLRPFWATQMLAFRLQGDSELEALNKATAGRDDQRVEHPAKWEEWHLVLEGKSYYSQFTNEAAWRKFYSGRDDDASNR